MSVSPADLELYHRLRYSALSVSSVTGHKSHTSNAFDRIHQGDPPLPARDDVGGLSKLLAVKQKRKLTLSSLATSGTEQLQARRSEGSDSGASMTLKLSHNGINHTTVWIGSG